MFEYLNGELDLELILEVGDSVAVRSSVDASYGVHSDFKGHSGGTSTLGKGVVHGKSVKQKINTKSSCEAEIVSVSDYASQVIWIREFLIHQGYAMKSAIIEQDNMGAMAMMNKGRSTSEKTRHINIRHFFITDRITSGEVELHYVATNELLSDLLTKPLQGQQFKKLRNIALNCFVINI
jgi:hypothetical protein